MQSRMTRRVSAGNKTSLHAYKPSHFASTFFQRPGLGVRFRKERGADVAMSRTMSENQLDHLRSMSVVVADTGEISLVQKYRPQDCTTNPSLVLKAVLNPEYAYLIPEAVKESKKRGVRASTCGSVIDPSRPHSNIADILAVNIGAEFLDVVPGRVSTEVDAHLSFDKQATIEKALKIVDLYAAKGIDSSRLYIKMASTWEGIEACRVLEAQGINCNMTLLFSFAQAAACADAGASLISPFVGRIMDWYKAKEGRDFLPHEDPGVMSVNKIYRYYKAHGFKTIVMAASFRNICEIRALAGCDNITIAPNLLAELEACKDPLVRKLSPDMDFGDVPAKISGFTREQFDMMHGSDQMAVEKLQQGIDGFSADQRKLEDLIAGLVL